MLAAEAVGSRASKVFSLNLISIKLPSAVRDMLSLSVFVEVGMWSPFELAYLTMVILSFVILAVVLYGVEQYCRQPSQRVSAADKTADPMPVEGEGSLGPA